MMLARLETTYAVAGTNSTAKCRYLRIPSALVHTHRVSREQRAREQHYRERPLVDSREKTGYDGRRVEYYGRNMPREFFDDEDRQLSEMLTVPRATTVWHVRRGGKIERKVQGFPDARSRCCL